MGRPIVWQPDDPIWESIFFEISEGSTIRACLSPVKPDRPSIPCFYDCLKTYPDLNKQYAVAREIKARVLIDDVEHIANDRSEDTFIDEKGITRINNAAVQRDRLRVGAIQWRAEKELSSEYGNKVDINQTVNISLRDQLNLSREKVINPKMPVQIVDNSHSGVLNQGISTQVIDNKEHIDTD